MPRRTKGAPPRPHRRRCRPATSRFLIDAGRPHLKPGRRKRLARGLSRVRAPMREEELAERPYRSLRPFLQMVAAASEGARILELDGVLASVVPVTPDRSVTNSVAYHDARTLDHALERLAAAYAGAGVRAWTVWVPER